MSFLAALRSLVAQKDNPFAGGFPSILRRFLHWQIVSRLWGQELVFAFVSDSKLIARTGLTAATSEYYFGLDEVSAASFVLHALRANHIFCDVGANIGAYTVLAAAVRGARVVACEPDRNTAVRFMQNINLNGVAERVTLNRVVVGDVTGEIEFGIGLGAINQVSHGLPVRSETAPVRTLDDLLGANGADFIKVDVVGYEEPVLRGATATLSNARLFGIILGNGRRSADFGRPVDACDKIVRSHGFVPISYNPVQRHIDVIEAPDFDRESLYVRDVKGLQAIVATSPAFSIRGREF